MIWREIFFSSFLVFVVSAQAATYQDMSNDKPVLVIAEDKVTLIDVERPAKGCDPAEPFVCIRSQSFSLAVPRDPTVKKWSFEGSRYEISSTAEREIFGDAYTYKIIEVSGSMNFKMIYSRSRGLIAIKEPTGNTLMLHEKCGVLVQDGSRGCKQIQ